jgi:hypothetical protein
VQGREAAFGAGGTDQEHVVVQRDRWCREQNRGGQIMAGMKALTALHEGRE